MKVQAEEYYMIGLPFAIMSKNKLIRYIRSHVLSKLEIAYF